MNNGYSRFNANFTLSLSREKRQCATIIWYPH